MKKVILLTILSVLFIVNGVLGATILVPDDFATIQEAVDNSASGDTVIVSPGTYFETVRIWTGHNIVLTSSNGPQQTIIDGLSEGTALGIHEGTVEGFTIRNGFNANSAGGVTISGEATISNCWITNNVGEMWGGAINCGYSAKATIVNNLIINNECYIHYDDTGYPADDSYGAGIFFEQGTQWGLVANNTISGNICHGTEDGTYAGKGGAIWIATGEITVVNNIITQNEAGECPAVATYGSSATTLFEKNNIWDNFGSMNSCNSPEAEMSIDPIFTQGPLGNYYLSHAVAGQPENSPCINAGNNTAAFWGLDTFTTRTDSIADSEIVDMGYHYPVIENAVIPMISTNRLVYQSGDPFILTLQIVNSGSAQIREVFVVLEAYQNYWFWPAWSPEIDYETWSLPSNGLVESYILDFIWPNTEITGDARFWAATVDSDEPSPQYNYDFCEFSF